MKQASALAIVLVVLSVSFPISASAAGDPTPTGTGGADPRSSAAPASSSPAWLTGYRFHLTAASIRADDPRFNWDAHFGGDVDLLDYGAGRLNVLADYAVIIGSEYRAIDPNQGAYNLAASASLRSGRSEVRAVFDHTSRHLSDRANRTAVAWNAAGVAATAHYAAGKTTATVTACGLKIVQAAFVDYTWQFGAGVDAVRSLSPRAALVGRANLAPTLVDSAVAGRSTQTAARLEAAVRLGGTGAIAELFVAWERRLDPYPLERATRSWALLGFRLVNK